MSNRKSVFCAGFIMLVLAVTSFVYWGSKKEVWFCDEVYSYESANGFEQDWPAENVAQWMTGADVEAFFAADSGKMSLNDITVRLYCDHVPLYFWLFRIVSILFFPGSGTIWIGLSINLFFYLLFLLMVYVVFCRLTDNPVLSCVVVTLTCIVNRLMLEQATMLRMYMMLLWAEGLLLLAEIRILQDIRRGKMSFWAFGGLFLISVTGFLTHYDFWIYYAATATVFCLWFLCISVRKNGKAFWKSKEFQCVLALGGNFIAALLTTILVFPYCRWNLNRGKGQMALNSVFVFSREKMEHIAWGYRRLSANLPGAACPTLIGVVLIFGCLLGGVWILHKKGKAVEAASLALAALSAQAYQLVVCFTLPDVEEERYLWGAFTIMLLCFCYSCILLLQTGLSAVRNARARKACTGVIAVILSVVFLVGELVAIDGGNGIMYLFYREKDVDVLREYSDIPWIVYGPTMGVYSYYDWLIPEQICFLSPDNTPEDAQAVSVLAEREQFVLYLEENYYPYAIDFFEKNLGGGIEGQYLMRSTGLKVYLMSRTKTDH